MHHVIGAGQVDPRLVVETIEDLNEDLLLRVGDNPPEWVDELRKLGIPESPLGEIPAGDTVLAVFEEAEPYVQAGLRVLDLGDGLIELVWDAEVEGRQQPEIPGQYSEDQNIKPNMETKVSAEPDNSITEIDEEDFPGDSVITGIKENLLGLIQAMLPKTEENRLWRVLDVLRE